MICSVVSQKWHLTIASALIWPFPLVPFEISIQIRLSWSSYLSNNPYNQNNIWKASRGTVLYGYEFIAHSLSNLRTPQESKVDEWWICEMKTDSNEIQPAVYIDKMKITKITPSPPMLISLCLRRLSWYLTSISSNCLSTSSCHRTSCL